MNPQHEKVFTLHKPELDLGKIMPQSRREVAWTKTLTLGARLFYCILFDYSVYTGKNMRQGVVRLANSFLARRFGVSIKTIRNWKTELRDAQLVFMTERAMQNTWPMTVYHFPKIIEGGQIPLPDDSESEDGLFPEDETETLSNRRRSGRLSRDPKTGKWQAGGSKTVESSNGALSEQNTDSVDHGSTNLPAAQETGFRPPRKPVARDNGKPLPATQETDYPPRGKPVAAVAGKPLPPTQETDYHGAGNPIADNREAQVRDSDTQRVEAPPVFELLEDNRLFKKWEIGLDKLFHRELREIKVELKRGLATSQSEIGRAFMRRKLKAVEERLTGPQPHELPATKAPLPKPKKAVPGPGMVAIGSEASAKAFAKAKMEAGL